MASTAMSDDRCLRSLGIEKNGKPFNRTLTEATRWNPARPRSAEESDG